MMFGWSYFTIQNLVSHLNMRVYRNVSWRNSAWLTISLRMLISLKSMRFSSSSIWLLRRTLTARWAPDSLCTHMRTSPNAPDSKIPSVRYDCKSLNWMTYRCREPCRFCSSHGACLGFYRRSQQHGCHYEGCSGLSLGWLHESEG